MTEENKSKEEIKKPFWKKWWVWLIVVFVIIIVSSGDETTQRETITTEEDIKVVEVDAEDEIIELELTRENTTETTLGERNALKKAKDYLNYTAFSYSGLVNQLKYEGFSDSESVYGVDNSGADWNEQAVLKAKQYMDYTSFSRDGLISQLKYEGFTQQQAEYGAQGVGY